MESKKNVLIKLFLSTLYLSAFTFGGGYVIVTLMQRKFVDQYHWIDKDEMLDLVAIAQSAPGAIAVNGAIVVGYKLAGFIGAVVAIIATIILATCADPLLRLLTTPPEAFSQAHDYVTICFLGTPFIVAYNVISAIFRGFGDSRHPMYFVALAGLLNVGLDLAFIGGAHMQAAGAALATVISQAFSVAAALVYLNIANRGIRLRTTDLAYDWAGTRQILTIGTPIALQELCIQVSFIVITAIANGRGLEISASVGIVEKIISFLFLVPSAMLSTVSVVAGQNAGARQHSRSKTALRYGITMCVIYGAVICIACQIWGADIVRIFSPDDETVVRYGAQYLSSYSFDCILAGVHFCFSGF